MSYFGRKKQFIQEQFSRAPTLDDALRKLRREKAGVIVYGREEGGFWLVDRYGQPHLLPPDKTCDLADLLASESEHVGTLAKVLSGDQFGETAKRFEDEMKAIRAAHIAMRAEPLPPKPRQNIDDLLADL